MPASSPAESRVSLRQKSVASPLTSQPPPILMRIGVSGDRSESSIPLNAGCASSVRYSPVFERYDFHSSMMTPPATARKSNFSSSSAVGFTSAERAMLPSETKYTSSQANGSSRSIVASAATRRVSTLPPSGIRPFMDDTASSPATLRETDDANLKSLMSHFLVFMWAMPVIFIPLALTSDDTGSWRHPPTVTPHAPFPLSFIEWRYSCEYWLPI